MTKKLLFVLFIVSTALNVFGQRPTLRELITKTNCTDFDCYENYMTSKNFCFLKSTDGEYGKYYTFNSCDFINDGPRNLGVSLKNTSTLGLLTTGATVTGIATPSNTYYQTLSTELRSLGFTIIGQPETEGTTITRNYTSSRYPRVFIMLIIQRVENNGTSWQLWNFTVRRDR